MKEVRNCKKCNMAFTAYDDAEYCKKCEAETRDEETYQKIREYLYDNPGMSMMDLSAKFNVGIARIKQYVQSGRLEMVAGSESKDKKK